MTRLRETLRAAFTCYCSSDGMVITCALTAPGVGVALLTLGLTLAAWGLKG